jgi:hypothetical protein
MELWVLLWADAAGGVAMPYLKFPAAHLMRLGL